MTEKLLATSLKMSKKGLIIWLLPISQNTYSVSSFSLVYFTKQNTLKHSELYSHCRCFPVSIATLESLYLPKKLCRNMK